jgi:hypothetical protein
MAVNAEKLILNLGLWCLTTLSTIFVYIKVPFKFVTKQFEII